MILMIKRPLESRSEDSKLESRLDFYGIPYSEFGGNAWFFDTDQLSKWSVSILESLGAIEVEAKLVNMTVIYTMMDVIEQVHFYDGERHLEMYGDLFAMRKSGDDPLIDSLYWFNTAEADWSLGCEMPFYIVKKTAED
jgi:hypothetical protein